MVFFAVALWALQDSLREYRYGDIAAAVRDLPAAQLAFALAITACGYLVLAGYDLLGFRFVGRTLHLRELGLVSFISNALGNSVGNIVVTGAAVRYWMYTSLGIPAADVASVVVFCSLGFWLGFLALGALWFIPAPTPLPADLHVPGTTTAPLGYALLALLGCYVALVTARRAPLWHRLGRFAYRHREHFYNFRGLRAYKEKFRPVWGPLYLASPGGVALPAILLDVTALIAGGYAGIFSKQAAKAQS